MIIWSHLCMTMHWTNLFPVMLMLMQPEITFSWKNVMGVFGAPSLNSWSWMAGRAIAAGNCLASQCATSWTTLMLSRLLLVSVISQFRGLQGTHDSLKPISIRSTGQSSIKLTTLRPWVPSGHNCIAATRKRRSQLQDKLNSVKTIVDQLSSPCLA